MIVIFIVASLLTLYLFLWFLSYIKSKALDAEVEDAVSALDIPTENIESISEEQATKTLNKYATLYSKVTSALSFASYFPKRDNQFEEFVSLYDTYSERVTLQNRRENTKRNIDESLPKAKEAYHNAASNRYYTSSAQTRLNDEYESLFESIACIPELKLETLVDYNSCKTLQEYSNDDFRKEHNRTYVKQELDRCKQFFDTALEYPLDDQQRKAIVEDEDNNLVISSAGSGKTSTIVGKTKYLVDVKGVKPEKILLITFTRKAAAELSERLNIPGLTACTFHKLALDIVSKYKGKPSLTDTTCFDVIFGALMRNQDFKQAIINYYALMTTKDDFFAQTSEEYYKERRKGNIVALLPDMDGNRIFTKSNEEKKICFYLSSLGVNFRYEESYQFPTQTSDYRQYKPDFSIYFTDKAGRRQRIYLEHYAVDAKGNVPQWFAFPQGGVTYEMANARYNAGIVWKQQLHRKNGTVLIQTRSADFQKGTIREVLAKQLLEAGVPIRNVPTDELYENIVKFAPNKRIESMALNMIQAFITLMKCGAKNIDDLIAKATKEKDPRNRIILSTIIKPFYLAYIDYLKQKGEIDFSDLIADARHICEKDTSMARYEYILVDEFQDISQDRFLFIQALRKKNPLTKLFCVGDDWQSIYRFAGSDMALFYDFEKFFGATVFSKIETTYRYGNPTIKLSSEFITVNKEQKVKNVRPFNKDKETYIEFRHYNENQEPVLLSNIVASISKDESVYIIGRYSFDADMILPNDTKPELQYPFVVSHDERNDNTFITCGGRKIKFLTIHKSKGLEADNIIIVNCNNGQKGYGFPSLIEDDPVLNLVLSESDHFIFSEERRLFYVAITRAKKKTYILYDQSHPSDFVTELNNINEHDETLCPRCQNGHKTILRKSVAKNGTPFTVWGCTNNASGCDYYERIFYNDI